jgi:hypothetical protein
VLDDGESADLVITVCDRAHEELAPGPGWWHWSTPDPVAPLPPGTAGSRVDGDVDPFDLALTQLDHRIRAIARPSPMEQAS